MYDPFTITEWLATPLDWGQVPLCLNWPVASAAHPAADPVPSGRMPNVPALVLTGDLDTVTPTGEGNFSASTFAHATRVIVPNGAHVTAIGDPSGCVSGIVNAFVQSGGTADTSCAATALPAQRLVPNFAATVSALSLRGVSGNTTAANLGAAYAAVLTANDSLNRLVNLYEASGSALRGGEFSSNAAGTKVTLTGAMWTGDLTVSGTVKVDATTGIVTADLDLSGVATGSVTATWNPAGPQGLATVTGTLGGASISVTTPAP